MYSWARSIVSSSTGTGGDPDVQYPAAALIVTAWVLYVSYIVYASPAQQTAVRYSLQQRRVSQQAARPEFFLLQPIEPAGNP